MNNFAAELSQQIEISQHILAETTSLLAVLEKAIQEAGPPADYADAFTTETTLTLAKYAVALSQHTLLALTAFEQINELAARVEMLEIEAGQ